MIARSVLFFLTLIFVYAVFAFVQAEVSAWEWGEEGRAAYAILGIIAAIMVVLVPWWEP